MKISTKGEYGIRALMELTQRYHEGYVQSTRIAAARNIPENYLYQLLITLRKAGLIKSRRGPQGGHMLARPPEQITLADAVAVLEGPVSPTSCSQEGVVNDCPFGEYCPVRQTWLGVRDMILETLSKTSFAQLAAREKENLAALRKEA
ncbi:MAG: Rrf2 family transcriptional regulator [Chloroflexi bacterium]|nr:Rrf2 family transcriptional regulator [Chloroflexota bacterium]